MSEQSKAACINIEKILSQVAKAVETNLQELFSTESRKVIILAGPTGTGKTKLSIQLAQLLGGEIISADSAQVYRGMDIGTAKISKDEQQGVVHHLIDIRNVDEPYNVFDFYHDAKACCLEIQKRGRVPIVVGGTGFYLHTLIYGPPQGPGKSEEVRKKLYDDYEKCGIEPLFDRLAEFDPQYASTIGKYDIHKVLRALEIITISGMPVSSFEWKDRTPDATFQFCPWFLYRERAELYPILDQRSLDMIHKGLIEEVKKLEELGLSSNKQASQAIGYKQTLEYLRSEKTAKDYELFVSKLQAATRQLAKRQFTWFRKEPLFKWLDVGSMSEEMILNTIISDFHFGREGGLCL